MIRLHKTRFILYIHKYVDTWPLNIPFKNMSINMALKHPPHPIHSLHRLFAVIITSTWRLSTRLCSVAVGIVFIQPHEHYGRHWCLNEEVWGAGGGLCGSVMIRCEQAFGHIVYLLTFFKIFFFKHTEKNSNKMRVLRCILILVLMLMILIFHIVLFFFFFFLEADKHLTGEIQEHAASAFKECPNPPFANLPVEKNGHRSRSMVPHGCTKYLH